MSDFFYRFRSTEALLTKHQELEKQEIFFAAPKELNDPMESYKDIVWKGDRIVWTNLLKHYLLCLMETVLAAYVCGPDCDLKEDDVHVLQTSDSLPTPFAREIYDKICERFFLPEDFARLPELLSGRRSPVRRDELIMYFRFTHLHALNTVLTVIEDHGIVIPRPAGDPLRSAARNSVTFKQLFDAQEASEAEHPERVDFVGLIGTSANRTSAQLDLINDYNGISLKAGLAWRTIISAFPERYVNQLERLLYPEWYTACFVGEDGAKNASMWGIYGDAHRGVCLKFKAVPDASGKPSISLRQLNGLRGGTNGLKPVYGEVSHPFHQAAYQNKFVEIDFFRSLALPSHS
jgi:hypothetical protein